MAVFAKAISNGYPRGLPSKEKVCLIDRDHGGICLSRQVELLKVSRSVCYYQPRVDSEESRFMCLIDEQYTRPPFAYYCVIKYLKKLTNYAYAGGMTNAPLPKIERKFAEGKQHHGMKKTRYWGLAKVSIQNLMVALVVNLKRLVKLLLPGHAKPRLAFAA